MTTKSKHVHSINAYSYYTKIDNNWDFYKKQVHKSILTTLVPNKT